MSSTSRSATSSSLRLAFALLAAGVLSAQESVPVRSGTEATDPAYRLSPGDRVVVSVFGEPDLSAGQIIDREGRVRLPLIGAIGVVGYTVREAEGLIENAYRDQEYLKRPQVTLTMQTYAPREITLLGAVRSPGTFQFPPDVTSLDLRDVIARQGGFTPVAKGDAVSVTRRQSDGTETTTTVDVARSMSGRGRGSGEVFLVYPGDRIFVPERLF